jgi:hypothetical protein
LIPSQAVQRILFIAFRFPPYNTVGAVRSAKLAQYWHARGADLRVLSAEPQALAANLASPVPEALVTRTRWLDVNALPAAVLGGRRRTAEQGYFTDRPALSLLGRTWRALVNVPDGEVGWMPCLLRAARERMRGWRPDFIYATARPYTALLAARRLSRESGVPWFAELRDLWTEHQFHPSPPVRRLFERRLERATLASARGIVTVSEPLAERLRRFGPPVEIVMNGYDPLDYPPPSPASPAVLRIVYTGMIYPGFSDPRPLFAALAQLKDRVPVRVEFYGRSHRAPLLAAARERGVEDRVTVSGPVSHAESLALQRGADLLLLLLWSDRTQKGIYSGKIFEYLGARRPVLGVGPGEDVAGALLRQRGAGFVGDDPDAIARWIGERWADKQRGGIADLPESACLGLSREEQFARLDRFVEERLA